MAKRVLTPTDVCVVGQYVWDADHQPVGSDLETRLDEFPDELRPDENAVNGVDAIALAVDLRHAEQDALSFAHDIWAALTDLKELLIQLFVVTAAKFEAFRHAADPDFAAL